MPNKIFVFALFALLGLGGCASTLQPKPDLKLTFISVGEGDSTLIQTANGSVVLIDTGSPPGIKKIRKTLSKEKINEIDAIIITHPDLDHIGNIFSIKDEFKTQQIFDNGQPVEKESQQNDFYRWYAEDIRSHPEYQILRSAYSLFIDDLELQVLWPPPGDLDSNWNKNSLVLGIKYQGKKILLMGDALRATEKELLPLINEYHSADLLKAGHHGSIDTGSTEFIDAIAPAHTIISVNENNIRGYPDKNVLENYAKKGKVYRTNESGNITALIYSDGEIKITTEKINVR